MVRRGGRSRACKTCRQRRIKCDEVVPECSQCCQAGRKCPGPIEGLFFITMGEKARSKSHTQPGSAVTESSRSPKDGRSDKLIKCSAYPQVVKPYQTSYQLPPECRSLVAGAADQCFLGCFISSYQTSIVCWPSVLSEVSAGAVLKLAVRAGTMAFYGKFTRNILIQTEASRWYEKAIQVQVARLSKVSAVHDSGSTSPEDILIPLMLALFESSVCTTPMGWIYHLTAAGKLLEGLGPEACQTGVLRNLFCSLRLNQVYISATLQEPSPFASDAWREIPFLKQPKQPLDKIVDILLEIPQCLALSSRLESLQGKDQLSFEAIKQELARQIQSPIYKLSQWWSLHHEEVFGDYNYDAYIEPAIPIVSHAPEGITFPDAATATTIAFYDTANIFAQHLLSLVSETPAVCETLVKQHAASALAAANYHKSCGPYSGGTFMMIYPLKVISLITPCDKQRRQAQRALFAWGTERGLEGACKEAEPFSLGDITKIS